MDLNFCCMKFYILQLFAKNIAQVKKKLQPQAKY